MTHLTRQWGVNVHFMTPSAGALAQLSAAYSVARQDFFWTSIEKPPGGSYTFGTYDKLHASLAAANVSAYFILDYDNPQLNCTRPLTSPRCIAAFCSFATAAMAHYADARPRVIWELWNEPNTVFWGSQHGNASQYAVLAHAVHVFGIITP